MPFSTLGLALEALKEVYKLSEEDKNAITKELAAICRKYNLGDFKQPNSEQNSEGLVEREAG